MSIEKNLQLTLGSHEIYQIVDNKHQTAQLADALNWQAILSGIREYYSSKGRRGLNIRMIAGLILLKEVTGFSDPACCDRLANDLYWMYFCGVNYYQMRGDFTFLSPSSLGRFRKRVGPAGVDYLLNHLQPHSVIVERIRESQ